MPSPRRTTGTRLRCFPRWRNDSTERIAESRRWRDGAQLGVKRMERKNPIGDPLMVARGYRVAFGLGRIVLVWLLLSICVPILAAGPKQELTSVGAERAGNADGSIPAWTGGLLSPPTTWSSGEAYTDPFADDKPLFEITARNAEKYRERLSPGLLALLARYPNFRMPVYPTRRTAAYPKEIIDHAAEQAPKVQLVEGSVQHGGTSTIPFPVPKNGLEAIWNHLLRYLGGGVERSFDAFSVRPNGDYLRIGFHDQRVYDANFDQSMPNRLFSYLGYFLSPADFVGTIYLVHEPIDQVKESRKAWIYNAGQRRVRRAPDLAYDNVQNGSDGLAVVDQYDGYNGAPDRYDWTILGKQEIYVAYNGYRIGDKKIDYDQIIRKGSVNPDLMRYELHRVWVLEARLKPGQSHVYARRVFYLDEDSWSVLLSDAYDSHGMLWRTGIHALVQYYDAVVPWYRMEIWHDLSNGAYVLTGLDNKYKEPWKFGVKGRMADFQPDALRRMGR